LGILAASLIIIEAVAGNWGSSAFLFGLILAIGAATFFFAAPNAKTYSLMLRTANGDQQVCQSRDAELMQQMKNAIERAVTLRG
jgi:hypothetical protein